MTFHFPRVKFVSTNSAEQQATHIVSEADEFWRAITTGESTNRIDEEAMDMLHSLETYFRIRECGRGACYVEDLKQSVIRKNRERGYYGAN